MPRTSTDELVRELKRRERSKDLLVPLIEDFMRKPVEIEDDEDRYFLQTLIEARSQPRRKNVYSPSHLSSCVRQVYLFKTGAKAFRPERISASGYFIEGNFRHFKWQFISWKMHRAGIIQLVDVGSICLGSEIFVCNDRGDFGGTIDTLLYLPKADKYVTVDWKGMNVSNFLQALAVGSPPLHYMVQISGYAGLANSCLNLPKKIDSAIVVYENKAGPIINRAIKSPLGLKEYNIDIQENLKEVAVRLKKLRAAERSSQMPDPECRSTTSRQFKDCPFAPVCRGEVQVFEKQNQKKKKRRRPRPQFIKKR